MPVEVLWRVVLQGPVILVLLRYVSHLFLSLHSFLSPLSFTSFHSCLLSLLSCSLSLPPLSLSLSYTLCLPCSFSHFLPLSSLPFFLFLSPLSLSYFLFISSLSLSLSSSLSGIHKTALKEAPREFFASPYITSYTFRHK